MKYKRCHACDFWVTTGEKRCPNCGINDPRAEKPEHLPQESPMTDGTRAAFGGFIGAIIGGFLMNGMGVAVGVAVGVSLGVILGADREWPTAADLSLKRSVTSLRQHEETIRQRLKDIEDRQNKLQATRKSVDKAIQNANLNALELPNEMGQVRETGEVRWAKVRNALDSAEAVLARSRERYHAKLWEIALVRWQNNIEPIAGDWDNLTHEDSERYLRDLTRAQQRGQSYLEEWKDVDVSDIPEAAHCISQLKKSLVACDQLHEALIVHQATLAVKGIAPIDDALSAGHAPVNLQNMDIFSARAAIGEFSNAFNDLEAEYARLRSEEEIAEQAILMHRAS
jgi:hypothetical protein